MTGPYAKVIDEIDPYWKAESHQLTDLPSDVIISLDRVMAYYHVDLIQRFFRDLGLFCLDEYAHLNPLHVHLVDRKQRSTSYEPVEGYLYLDRLSNTLALSWTAARDARTIYHEYTHAVTDAVARLGRSTLINRKHGRLFQILQARAMDEGLADYFACSLAARQGAAEPQFGILKFTAGGELVWTIKRDLAPSSAMADGEMGALTQALTSMKAQCDALQTNDDWEQELARLPYDLAVRWGRYLWRVRVHISGWAGHRRHDHR